MKFEGPRDPSLLRIPEICHSVEEALAVAQRLNLGNVVVLSELSRSSLILHAGDLSVAELNWMLDRAKRTLWDNAMGVAHDRPKER